MRKVISNRAKPMKTARFKCVVFVALVASVIGCLGPVHHPDPLAGWKPCWSQDPGKLGKAIVEDYQGYIRKLPLEERRAIGVTHLFEDGTGQHAIRFEIALNGTDWAHILIYNKEDKRIKVIKYASGRYRS
jgi:hypothetical protein